MPATWRDRRAVSLGYASAVHQAQRIARRSLIMPRNLRTSNKMVNTLSSVFQRATAYLTPSASSDSIAQSHGGFAKAPEGELFPKVDPAVDGENCDHDCESCSIKYPSNFKVEEDDKLYGHIKGWATHMLVATGKTDWVRDIEDEKGSVMEAVGKYGKGPTNGKLMLSASNMPIPLNHEHDQSPSAPTTVLLLPSFTLIDDVTPSSVPELITHHVNLAPTTTTPLLPSTAPKCSDLDTSVSAPASALKPTILDEQTLSTSSNLAPPTQPPSSAISTSFTLAPPSPSASPPPTIGPESSPFTTRSCPHDYIILLCSQRTRDARCGQSAPLLRREFERHLRPLGLYRDLHDERPRGVGIYFISHVGGHKYSANVMIYRRQQKAGGANADVQGEGEEQVEREGGQCIWLARVRPEDCEGIIKFTLLQGKVVKPERQLRGGFDRERGLVSW